MSRTAPSSTGSRRSDRSWQPKCDVTIVWSAGLVRRRGVLVPQDREALLRQAIERSGVIPNELVTDYHQPYVKAVATTCPGAQRVRTGLHRERGETTKAIDLGHVPMRDRLRNSRGLKRIETGQRFS
jgi:hypothetical protein